MVKSFLNRITGRSFHGGPDAHRRFNYKVLLDKDLLTFCIPCTSPMAFPVLFPYQTPGWFELYTDQRQQHRFVCINQQQYWYSGHFLRTRGEPLGQLMLSIWLKQVTEGKSIARHNIERLGHYLSGQGKDSSSYIFGSSAQLNTALQQYHTNRRSNTLTAAQRQDYAATRHKTILPQCYSVKSFGSQPWLHYTHASRAFTRQYHYYCYPLSEQFYLKIRFAYKANLPAYFHYWHANARAAQQSIMQSVKLRLHDV
ncbi:hypothetical protein SAMN05660691_00264 [Rheinheimera pacifica]|uniref:Uncharacterized protein n=1 Tax=Rheinheimera pacifica TaxID=173990 RepID=A0A1H6J785_9GAMM|nr:hypothetical protein [Rheinheimera pacifica]SEH57576.1 hypothetical protein SAMN05660691_00264 [Rheinheimera pacifica]